MGGAGASDAELYQEGLKGALEVFQGGWEEVLGELEGVVGTKEASRSAYKGIFPWDIYFFLAGWDTIFSFRGSGRKGGRKEASKQGRKEGRQVSLLMFFFGGVESSDSVALDSFSLGLLVFYVLYWVFELLK